VPTFPVVSFSNQSVHSISVNDNNKKKDVNDQLVYLSLLFLEERISFRVTVICILCNALNKSAIDSILK